MNRGKIAFLIAFGIAAFVVGFVSLASAADMQQQMFGVSAQINNNCSGTLIHSARDNKSGEVETYVLTAKHCVKAEDKLFNVNLPVYQKNRIVKINSYAATVYGKAYFADLALLKLRDKQTWFEHVAKIGSADAELAMGEDVWTVGYPEGRSLTVTTGLFTSAETIDFPTDGQEYYRATPNIIGGNSGGALFHLENGEYRLIGVTSARSVWSSWVAYYVPREAIREYLSKALPAAIAEPAPAVAGASK